MTADAATPPAPRPGDRVALPLLTTVDGRRLVLPAAGQRAIVLTFFTTDCAFCPAHDQRMQRLSQAMHGRGLAVVGVAGERSGTAVQDYARRLGLAFDLVLDPDGALRRRFTARRIVPFVAVLDGQGVLREAIPGALSDDDAMALSRWAEAA